MPQLDGPAESKGADDFDDAKSVAKSVLSEDKAIGAVHSEKSLGQVAEARKTAIASAMAAIQEEHAPAPPKMVKVRAWLGTGSVGGAVLSMPVAMVCRSVGWVASRFNLILSRVVQVRCCC